MRPVFWDLFVALSADDAHASQGERTIYAITRAIETKGEPASAAMVLYHLETQCRKLAVPPVVDQSVRQEIIALRAKILFSEGAFKKQTIRPKFERRREPERATRDFAMAYMCLERATPHQPAEPAREINFGADISTLTRLIESGEI